MIKLKWQPIILIVDNRVECECGALAVFVTGRLQTGVRRDFNVLEDVDVWCQDCFSKAQGEDR